MLDLGTLTGHLTLDTSGWTGAMATATRDVERMTLDLGALVAPALAVGAAVAAVGAAFAASVSAIAEAGGEMEAYETRLGTLMGSADAARERMEVLFDFAASTPFELSQVVQAETTLRGFGAAAGELLPGLIDFAATTGAELSQAAIDIGKAWSQGATGLESDAGRVLRKQIELSTGMDAAKMSLDDFHEALLNTLNTGMFAGGAERLSRTWVGMISNLKDEWSRFKLEVADAGVFDNLKGLLSGILDLIGQHRAEFGKIAEVVSGALWAGVKLVLYGVGYILDQGEAWLGLAIRIGEVQVAAADAFLGMVHAATFAAMDVAKALGQDSIAVKLFDAATAVVTLRQGAEEVGETLRGWGDGIDYSLDKIATARALIANAEAIGAGIATGEAAKGTAAAATGTGKGTEGAPSWWIDAMRGIAREGAATGASLIGLSGELDGTIATLDAMISAMEAARQAFLAFWKDIGQQAVGLAGQAGSAVQSAVNAGAAAGPAGAAASLAMSLLQANETMATVTSNLDAAFVGIADAVTPLVRGVADVLEPALDLVTMALTALAPVFEFIGQILSFIEPSLVALGSIFYAFGYLMNMLFQLIDPVLPIVNIAFFALFELLKGIGVIILGVIYGVQTAWNAILSALQSVLSAVNVGGVFDDFIDKLDSMKADADQTANALSGLLLTTYDSADATTDLTASTVDATEAMDDVTEALTNVPSGYKVALAQFNAIAADAASAMAAVTSATSSLGGGATGGSSGTYRGSTGGRTGGTRREGRGGSSTTINVSAMTVRAADLATLADEARGAAEARVGMLRATPTRTAPRMLGRKGRP